MSTNPSINDVVSMRSSVRDQDLTESHGIDACPVPPNRSWAELDPDVIVLIIEMILDDYFGTLDEPRDQHNSSIPRQVLGGPWLFTQINHAWREAMISARSLWRRVDIAHGYTERMTNAVALLELMMERSDSMSLNIRFCATSYTTRMEVLYRPEYAHLDIGYRQLTPVHRVEAATPTDIALAKVCVKHCKRWRILDIAIGGTMMEVFNSVQGNIPGLEALAFDLWPGEFDSNLSPLRLVAFTDAPSLRSVSLPKYYRGWLPIPSLLPLLGLTQYHSVKVQPNDHIVDLRVLSHLVKCSLCTLRANDPYSTSHSEIISMPNLTHLEVDNIETLAFIHAPAIKHLDTTKCRHLGEADSDGWMSVSSFIHRSSAELESFKVHYRDNAGVLMTLRQLPSVKVVHIEGMKRGLFVLLSLHSCDSRLFSAALQTLVIDLKEIVFSGAYDLAGLLHHNKISLDEPKLNYTLLKIAFSAPPGDDRERTWQNRDIQSDMFRGEGRLVSAEEVYSSTITPALDWPM